MEFDLRIFTEKGTISIPVHFTSDEPIDYEEYEGTFGVVTIERHVNEELRKALQTSDDTFLTKK
jgi:hypothetical protein